MLDFIRTHVTQWPEDANFVFVDPDGEIRFSPNSGDDFYPIVRNHFQGEGSSLMFTREQWQQPETDLTTLDIPFGELDRATQLRLVEHVLDGGGVDRFEAPEHRVQLWVYQKNQHTGKLLCFVNRLKYRATNPLQREIEQKRKELDELIERSKNA
jgi:hypothetical protein